MLPSSKRREAVKVLGILGEPCGRPAHQVILHNRPIWLKGRSNLCLFASTKQWLHSIEQPKENSSAFTSKCKIPALKSLEGCCTFSPPMFLSVTVIIADITVHHASTFKPLGPKSWYGQRMRAKKRHWSCSACNSSTVGSLGERERAREQLTLKLHFK